MCGICGFVGDKEEKKTILSEMMSAIRHRGPDNEGIYQDEEISFGFCRLSIIDMKTGNQPMFNEDRTKCLIFNGEIYNYRELREELQEKGHVFSTGSDSEVLLHGYEEYGEDLLLKLRGMFAICYLGFQKENDYLQQETFLELSHFIILL